MKKRIFIILCGICLNHAHTHAQDLRALEIGLSMHSVVGIGDAPVESFNPIFSPAFVVRYNLPYRLAIKGSFSPKYTFEKPRDPATLKGWEVNKVTRLMLGVEYHFKDFNVYDSRRQFAPYALLGASYNLGNVTQVRDWPTISLNRGGAVFGLGAKSRVLPYLVASAEISAGYLMSDDYDRIESVVAATGVDYPLRTGTDWYVFPNLTITYTFGANFTAQHKNK